ncbi:MAG TPA: ABC transporter permease [Blastocatellia bacterium]|nr:ABC transporter permease [Blastocatellia bacterium]
MNIRQLRGWLMRLFGLFHRKRREREFADELESHLAMHIEDNLRAGMSPEEARRVALVKLGGVTQVQELHRGQRGLPMLETLFHDLRFGARMLFKNPSFTLIAVVTLALGIGANTAIFSVVNAVLLRALPYPEPERLVRFCEINPGRGWLDFAVSAPNFVHWRKQQSVCEQLAAYQFNNLNFTGGGEPERVAALSVTANFFSVLGVAPAHGRNFLPEEEQPGRNHVAVLSDGLWGRRFGADPNLIGRQIQLSGESYTVVGVMPPDFQFTQGAELWMPLTLPPAGANGSAGHNLSVIGRLKPGVSLAQAQASMGAIARQLEQQYPESNTGWGVRMNTFYDWIVPEQIRRSMLTLFAAVGFVLLISCANVANLLLARASARRPEMAIRAAMGASRWRVMRQLLTESLLLSTLGGLVGSSLAFWCTDLIKASTALNIPRLNETRLDVKALGFTFLIALGVGLIFGLAPAWQASKLALNETLKEGGRSGSGGKRQRLRGALVIAEIALALTLLVGAGLMIRSFMRLQNVPLGFAPNHVLTMRLALPTTKYGQGAPRVNFFDQLLQRLRATPGVIDASAIYNLPLAGGDWAEEVTLEGRDAAPSGTPLPAEVNAVTPRYFQTMGIPMLAGRDFTEQDRGAFWLGESPWTLIVNETFARRYWPNENPIGKRFRFGDNVFGTVIGVVGDVRSQSLEREARPAFYVSHGHFSWPALTIVVRASAPPEAMTAALRAQVYALDHDLPVYNIRPMEQIVSNAAGQPRFQTLLLGLFGAAALLLAAIGIYGVMAYAVTQRTREIGVRMALGARTRDVLRHVLWQGMKLVLTGATLGLAGAFVAARALKSMLFGVSPADPLTFAAVTVFLALVAFAACWIPARRATKVDPLVALRAE